MVILRTLLFAYLVTACYSPELRDCAVACNQAADCAPEHVCGADGFCAAEAVAGRCAAGVDAGEPDTGTDTGTDAWPLVRLSVHIDGHGAVAIPTIGDCDGGGDQTECQFDVKQGSPITLYATPEDHWRFDRWSKACDGQATATCAIAPAMKASVHVRFEAADGVL